MIESLSASLRNHIAAGRRFSPAERQSRMENIALLPSASIPVADF
jgi:hypothetical protein